MQELFRKAKDGLFFKGDVEAQFRLGVCFDDGKGVTKDKRQAVEWYRKAAEQGLAEAQYNLGVMLATGRGVAKDEKQAVEWVRKAAEQGNAIAQYKIGVIFSEGHGVTQDKRQAVEWYRKAAEQGNAVAKTELERLQKPGEKLKAETRQQQEKAADHSLPTVPRIAWKEITLGELIGGGGFGKVYKGTWSQLKKEAVAIKRLHQAVLSPSLTKTFESEVENLSKCRHPSIVQLYGACVEPENYAIIMEYMPTSLGERLRELPKLPLLQRLIIGLDISQGLAYLHHPSRGILHRDLKSDNILLDDLHAQAKIGDFGLTKLAAQIGNTTSIAFGKTKGSMLWRAPELCVPGGKAIFATDVYSLGIILCELVTCELPYGGEKDVSLILAWKRSGEINIPEDCPKALAEIIQACIAVNPDKRPTASEVASRLELLVKEAEQRQAAKDQSSMKGQLMVVHRELHTLREHLDSRLDSVEIGVARSAPYTPQLEALDPLPLAPQTFPAAVRQKTSRVV